MKPTQYSSISGSTAASASGQIQEIVTNVKAMPKEDFKKATIS